jgi:hypothetical protein
VDVISNNRLTSLGQDYYETVWSFLCLAVPNICSLFQSGLDTSKSTFGTTTQTSLDNFWVGVPAAINPKTQIGVIAGLFGMGQSEFTLGVILILTIIALVFFIPRGFPAIWIVFCGLATVIFASAVGLVAMAIGLFIGLAGVELIVIALVARRATG